MSGKKHLKRNFQFSNDKQKMKQIDALENEIIHLESNIYPLFEQIEKLQLEIERSVNDTSGSSKEHSKQKQREEQDERFSSCFHLLYKTEEIYREMRFIRNEMENYCKDPGLSSAKKYALKKLKSVDAKVSTCLETGQLLGGKHTKLGYHSLENEQLRKKHFHTVVSEWQTKYTDLKKKGNWKKIPRDNRNPHRRVALDDENSFYSRETTTWHHIIPFGLLKESMEMICSRLQEGKGMLKFYSHFSLNHLVKFGVLDQSLIRDLQSSGSLSDSDLKSTFDSVYFKKTYQKVEEMLKERISNGTFKKDIILLIAGNFIPPFHKLTPLNLHNVGLFDLFKKGSKAEIDDGTLHSKWANLPLRLQTKILELPMGTFDHFRKQMMQNKASDTKNLQLAKINISWEEAQKILSFFEQVKKELTQLLHDMKDPEKRNLVLDFVEPFYQWQLSNVFEGPSANKRCEPHGDTKEGKLDTDGRFFTLEDNFEVLEDIYQELTMSIVLGDWHYCLKSLSSMADNNKDFYLNDNSLTMHQYRPNRWKLLEGKYIPSSLSVEELTSRKEVLDKKANVCKQNKSETAIEFIDNCYKIVHDEIKKRHIEKPSPFPF